MLSTYIGEDERIVTIEDTAELQLRQDHVVRMETRPPNIEGEGAIKQRQLVINSLRMRPNRIILGEVRGEEALDMLQAMNTGHDGSLATIHANSCRDAISRLEMMVGHGQPQHLAALDPPADRFSAIDVYVHVARLSDGSRRVTQIAEIDGHAAAGDVDAARAVCVREDSARRATGACEGSVSRHGGQARRCSKSCGARDEPLPQSLFDSVGGGVSVWRKRPVTRRFSC